MRACPNGIIDMYLRLTSGLESPEVYHLWACIAMICGAAGRSMWVDMAYSTLNVFPNMYIVLVGPSGIRKSSATRFGMKVLRDANLGIEILEGKLTIQYVVKRMGEIFVSSGVSRIIVHAEEFKVFASTANLNSSMLEDLACLYDSPEIFDYRTRGGGEIKVNNCNLNLIGASVPEWLTVTTGADFINSGFSARILYVWRDTQERRFSVPVKPKHYDSMYADILSDLRQIYDLKGPYTLSQKAFERYDRWYNDLSNFHTEDERLNAYMSRKSTHMLKLALVLRLSMDNSNIIELQDVDNAIQLLKQIEEVMPNAYNAVSWHMIGAHIERITGQIYKSKDQKMSYKELMGKNIRRMSKQMLDEALDSLLSSEQLIRVREKVGKRDEIYYKLHVPTVR